MFDLVFFVLIIFFVAIKRLRIVNIQCNVTTKKRDQLRKSTSVTNEQKKNSKKTNCCYCGSERNRRKKGSVVHQFLLY